MTVDLVPASVLSPPEAARRRVAVVASAASAAAALGGVWPRFDDGLLLRLVMGVTSAVLGGLLAEVALEARDARRAVGRALGLATVFGMMTTLAPAAIVSSHERHVPFAVCVIAGGFFGAFVGALYGIVLAVAVGLTWRHVNARTHEGADRAVRIAAGWATVPALLTAWVVVGHDMGRTLSEWASEAQRAAHAAAIPLGALALLVVFGVSAGSFAVAQRRILLRRRFLRDVARGGHHALSLRELDPRDARDARDDFARLPRLGPGTRVLERRLERGLERGAYRANAAGEPVALV